MRRDGREVNAWGSSPGTLGKHEVTCGVGCAEQMCVGSSPACSRGRCKSFSRLSNASGEGRRNAVTSTGLLADESKGE